MKKTGVILMMFLLIPELGAQAAFFEKEKSAEAQTGGPTFEQMMNQLSVNSLAWGQLKPADKKRAIDAVIQLYRVRDNTAIMNPSDFYVQKTDETIAGDPGVANLDLPQIIKILAVMEYDFYNGQNKEELAKQVLGDKMYEANRLRKQSGR